MTLENTFDWIKVSYNLLVKSNLMLETPLDINF